VACITSKKYRRKDPTHIYMFWTYQIGLKVRVFSVLKCASKRHRDITKVTNINSKRHRRKDPTHIHKFWNI